MEKAAKKRAGNAAMLVLAAVLSLSVLTGCGGISKTPPQKIAAQPSQQQPGKQDAGQKDDAAKEDDAGDTDDALEQAVSDAIISHNKGSFIDGDGRTFVTEHHKTLRTVVNGRTTEVYATALCAKYQDDGGNAKLIGAVSTPCAITLSLADGAYSVTDYWEPEDGANFNGSLRGRFPKDVVESGTDLPADAMDICDQRAADYFQKLGKERSAAGRGE